RGQLVQRAFCVAVVVLGLPHSNAWLEVHGHGHHHALGQGRTVAGRDREPVLCVERVVKSATKGQCRLLAELPSRGGGVGGAPPPRLAVAKLSHFLPQYNPSCTNFPTLAFRSPLA